MASTLLTAGSLRISAEDAEKIRGGTVPQQLFFDAVLARVEVNKNQDEFTADHLREVARTIANTPLDGEHEFSFVQGAILDAWFDEDEGALIASCVTWPERFPEVAAGLVDGSISFSIESAAREVECSSCLSRFSTKAGEKDYCACLQSRHQTKATSRKWIDNRGLGAAFTKDPAGSACDVRDGSMVLVASYDPAASPREREHMLFASRKSTPVPAAETTPPEGPSMEKIIALFASLIDQALAGELAEPTGDEETVALASALIPGIKKIQEQAAAALASAVEAARTEVTTTLSASHESALAAARAEGERALVTERRIHAASALASFGDIEAKRDLIASMSDDMWALTLSGYKAADARGATVTTPGAGVLQASVTEPAATPTIETPREQGDAKPESLSAFSW